MLGEDNGELDCVPVTANVMEKGGGDKTEIGCVFFSRKFQSKTDCSTAKEERVLNFIVDSRKDNGRVNAQRRAGEQGELRLR